MNNKSKNSKGTRIQGHQMNEDTPASEENSMHLGSEMSFSVYWMMVIAILDDLIF